MPRKNFVFAILCVSASAAVADTPKPTGPIKPPVGRVPAPTPIGKLGDNMGSAPSQAVPGKIAVQPPCQQQGYLALTPKEGQTFKMTVTTSAGCAGVQIMKANGNPNGLPGGEVCAGAPKTFDVVGQAGGKTLLSVAESGPCKGTTVTLAFD